MQNHFLTVYAKGSTVNTDVAKATNAKSALTAAALADITDFESAAAVFAAAGVVAESISEYGTGFTVVDKDRVVGAPFVAVEWRFNSGDFTDDNGEKREFVSVALVTKNGDKWVINDGGSGICEQFRAITDRRIANGHKTPQNGILVPGGLTVSRYTWLDDKGHEQPGTTYYLSESSETVR